MIYVHRRAVVVALALASVPTWVAAASVEPAAKTPAIEFGPRPRVPARLR